MPNNASSDHATPKNATPDRSQIVVTGSVAFDNIMDFPGYFKDHILPEKAHVINISFLVDKLTRQRGGCAANIAYTLALLGARPRIVAAAGNDFADYRSWLIEQGVDVDGITVHDDEMTANCYITTDRADCQITGFYVGAMKHAGELDLLEAAGSEAALVMIAPDDPQAMMNHAEAARQGGLPFFFDPSFQVTAMDGDSLDKAAKGAKALFLNDYEFSVLREKTGKTAEEIRREHEFLVVTYGSKGSEVLLPDGGSVSVPAAKVTKMVDPTGAGDAFRGGFMAGFRKGHDLGICGRMGSVAAVYCIEEYGTQNHDYTEDEFFARYESCFGTRP